MFIIFYSYSRVIHLGTLECFTYFFKLLYKTRLLCFSNMNAYFLYSSLLNCSLSYSSMLASELSFPLNSVLLGCYCLKTTDLTLTVCLWQEERKSKWGSMGQAWHYTWIYIIYLTFDLDLTLYILHRDFKLYLSKIQLHSFSQPKPIPPVVFPHLS